LSQWRQTSNVRELEFLAMLSDLDQIAQMNSLTQPEIPLTFEIKYPNIFAPKLQKVWHF
jgi:hypothetical protein